VNPLIPVIAAGLSDRIVVIVDKFGLDPWTVTAQALNFCIVAAILYYGFFRKVLQTMDERKSKIEAGLLYAEEMKQKLAESEEKQAQMLRESRQQAQEIIAQSRNTAKALLDQQAKETAAKVEQMLARGRESIELERRKEFESLKEQVARLVVLTTSKVLSRDLADGERATLNSHAAEELARNN
jgi:F-type H+-transporting ATPase subunit b